MKLAANEIYTALYAQMEDRLFPRERTILNLLGPVFRGFGAIAVGALAASFSVLVLFIIVNLVFTYQPN